MSRPVREPVVVVGLGPVGATVALLLARQGVDVLAVERDPEPFPHPRAVALDDAALRVLQAAGVLDDPGIDLLEGTGVRLQDGAGGTLVGLPPVAGTLGHPALAFFRQPELERALRARLAAEPRVEVRIGVEVTGVRQDPDGAMVTLRAAAGATGPSHPGGRRPRSEPSCAPATSVPAASAAPAAAGSGTGRHGAATPSGSAVTERRASWVLACDGGRSGLRRAAGVRLAGLTSARRWLVVDGDAPGERSGRGDFVFACDPRRPWVHGPLPGGAHRWELLLGSGEDRTLLERPDVVARLLGTRTPGPAPTVRRAAVYVFHARVAVRWRIGRTLLLGDAAHLAPPFAGQGLGAGLRDAHNVAWKVADVVAGRAPATLLDTYARERLPHVLRTTALALALGAVVQLRRRRAARVRDAGLRTLGRSAPVRDWLARGGWRPGERVGGPLRARRPLDRRAGEPVPQPRVVDPDGTSRPLDDVLGPGWCLVGVRGEPLPGADPDAAGLAEALGVRTVGLGLGASGDDRGVLAAWAAPGAVLLLRPDRVVFGTAGAGGGTALLRELARARGR